MHDSSLTNMRLCVDRFLEPPETHPLNILDVGGGDFNGNYRSVFACPANYFTADLDPSLDPDVAVRADGTINLASECVDLTLSGQMLEHCEDPVYTFSEMARVTAVGGHIFLIAPSAGPYHAYPLDCYRFYEDSYRVFAKRTGLRLVSLFKDDKGPWNDLVGVFAKDVSRRVNLARSATQERFPPLPPPRSSPPFSDNPDISQRLQISVEEGPLWSDPDANATRGAENYRDVLQRLHQMRQTRRYVEIGVRHGLSLTLAPGRAVGIDPMPELTVELPASASLHVCSSDRYFREVDEGERPDEVDDFDMAFIDGMHLFEFALRDFINLEKRSRPDALILIDDIFPCAVEQAARKRTTRIWTGDVWKLIDILRDYRPDLDIALLDTAPTGLAAIRRLDRTNRVLSQRYNPIVRQRIEADAPPPPAVLNREGSITPSSLVL